MTSEGPDGRPSGSSRSLWRRRETHIASLAVLAIVVHLILRYGSGLSSSGYNAPLLLALVAGGVPLVVQLLNNLRRREFGSDLLAGMSIVTSLLLGEYLAGAIVVLMLSGGAVLESYALESASSVLGALASRMPSNAHRRQGAEIADVALEDLAVGDLVVVYPHEICPVDGVVVDGRGVMDESYLTGEPFVMTKTSGSTVISGAKNGESMLTIRATQRSADSRYARIMEVMRESEQRRPKLRRLGDRLGAVYTPLALALASAAWAASGEPIRFLAVLVIATPCPLLIAIPVAIIGSISLSARRAIIVKNPAALEEVAVCRTAVFDKTGTLTYGEPTLTALVAAAEFTDEPVLRLAASLERYSKHPLARAIVSAADDARLSLDEVSEVSEPPGHGLRGVVAGRQVEITGRPDALVRRLPGAEGLPPAAGGLECVIVIDGRVAAALSFRDAPRAESRRFVGHLGPTHHFDRVLIVSGDREPEVRYLADQVGIREVYAEQSPEQKLAIVRRETARAKTLYVGDGINDAPAMMAATVGMAVGHNSDVTVEAAGIVAMDNSLRKVDEALHISRRMRSVALQSAVGGMVLSVAGMIVAAAGHLTPVQGAVAQEIIDVFAVLNALRAAIAPRIIHDL